MAAAWKPSLVFEGSLPPPPNTRGPKRSSKVRTPPLIKVKVIRPLSNGEEHWVSPQFDHNMQKEVRQKKKKSNTLTARTVLFDPPTRELPPTNTTTNKKLTTLNFTSTRNNVRNGPVGGVVTPPITPVKEGVSGFNPTTYSTPLTSVPLSAVQYPPNIPSLNTPYASTNIPCTSTCVPCTPSITSSSSDSILALDTPVHLYGCNIFDRNAVT